MTRDLFWFVPVTYSDIKLNATAQRIIQATEQACVKELKRLGYEDIQVEMGVFKSICRMAADLEDDTKASISRYPDMHFDIQAVDSRSGKLKTSNAKNIRRTCMTMWSAEDTGTWAAQVFAKEEK